MYINKQLHFNKSFLKEKSKMMTSPKWKLYPQIITNEIIKDAILSSWNENGKWGIYFRACEILFKCGVYKNQSRKITSLVEHLGKLIKVRINKTVSNQRLCWCGCHRGIDLSYDCKCGKKWNCDDLGGKNCDEIGLITEYNFEVGVTSSVVLMTSLVFKRLKLPKDLRIYIVKTIFNFP